jgi:FkbM family methyltransferase
MDYVPFNRQEFDRWIRDRGDQTLRVNYNLNQDSVIVDAGGYHGEFAKIINDKYGSIVFVLEPIVSLHERIDNLFSYNPRVIPLNYAIAARTEQAVISLDDDGSSLYADGNATETIQCVDVREFFDDNNIEIVDLLKLNIEGAEYDVLDRMIELDLLPSIKNMQVQFHRFVPDCDRRRKAIQESLSKTHTCVWNYDWIWEGWKLKD